MKALKIFNLNGIIESFDGDFNSSLNVNRSLGKLIIGKNRALISTPIVFETNEAYMRWVGDISKNNKGELDKLNLNLITNFKETVNQVIIGFIFGSLFIVWPWNYSSLDFELNFQNSILLLWITIGVLIIFVFDKIFSKLSLSKIVFPKFPIISVLNESDRYWDN